MDISSIERTDEVQAQPKPRPADVAAYHRAKRRIHIIDIVIGVLYWTAWVFAAPSLVSWIDGHVDSRWAALAIAAVVMIGGMVVVSLPLEYYSGFMLERRYQLTNQTPATWAWFQVKTWLLGSVIGGIVLGGLYALLWHGGEYWSVWLWCGVMLLSVVLAKLFPLVILPLFYPARPLDRPSLAERLSNMARGSGLNLTGIYDLQLSKDTKKANAMLAGLGSSRRVYFSDTLLEAFDDNQIAVVFAHELGHHIRGHIWKGIGLTALVSSALVALIHWRLNPFAGDPMNWQGAIGGFPQLVLISVLFPLLLAPITNAISRRFERQCDSDALRLTDDPAAYRTAFQKLGDMNMADPNPPRWEEILFDDHPAMSKRIAMADAYVRSRS
jgi:STE24 endopeptidase